MIINPKKNEKGETFDEVMPGDVTFNELVFIGPCEGGNIIRLGRLVQVRKNKGTKKNDLLYVRSPNGTLNIYDGFPITKIAVESREKYEIMMADADFMSFDSEDAEYGYDENDKRRGLYVKE